MTDKTAPEHIFQACLDARDKAYAPYSDHPVGCVVVDGNDNIIQGCNVEVAHFKGICAEGTAITQMILQGGKRIKDVYVIGPDLTVLCAPCGDCRQRLYEFSTPETRVHCLGEGGKMLQSLKLTDLLPYAFGPENLDG